MISRLRLPTQALPPPGPSAMRRKMAPSLFSRVVFSNLYALLAVTKHWASFADTNGMNVWVTTHKTKDSTVHWASMKRTSCRLHFHVNLQLRLLRQSPTTVNWEAVYLCIRDTRLRADKCIDQLNRRNKMMRYLFFCGVRAIRLVVLSPWTASWPCETSIIGCTCLRGNICRAVDKKWSRLWSTQRIRQGQDRTQGRSVLKA